MVIGKFIAAEIGVLGFDGIQRFHRGRLIGSHCSDEESQGSDASDQVETGPRERERRVTDS